MPRYLDPFTKTQMAKSWSSMEDPVVPLERNLYGHLLAGLMGKAIWKILLQHGWEKVSNCECLFVHRETGFFLICVWVRFKTGWEETQHWPNVESICGRSRFGRTNIFLWPRLFGLHSTRMRNKQRYCWQLQNHVWIQNFSRSNWKITMLGKSEYLFIVLWYGRSCKEMCGAILRAGEQNDTATVHSYNSMRWCPSL